MIRFLSSIKFIEFQSDYLSTNLEGIVNKNILLESRKKMFAIKEWTIDPK